MRTFIAIELPDAVKRRVVSRQRQLQQLFDAHGVKGTIRWTTPENLHLTLRFLGDTTSDQYAQIAQSLATLAAGQRALRLSVHRPGCFPGYRRPNIIWLDFVGDIGALGALQTGIESAVQLAGFVPEERPFTPHLTIGRAAKSATQSQLEQTGAILRQPPPDTARATTPDTPFAVDHLVFMHSDLQPAGPVYTVLSAHPFLGREVE